MAPVPTGVALCIACPRVLSRRAASASEKVPAAASAAYSPSECPATNCAVFFTVMPCSASSTRITAMETAISAGWAFSVRVRSASGPSHMSRDSFWFSAPSTSSNTARAAAKLSASALPMPTAWLPWPGNMKATPMKHPFS